MKTSTPSKHPSKPNKAPYARAWRAAFLKTLAVTGNVTAACIAAKCDRSTAYDLKKKGGKFAKQWEDALDAASDLLEAEAWRRANDGWKEPVFQQGKEVGIIQRYSDTLMVLLLKAHKPTKYRENVAHVHSGAVSFNTLSDKAANVERKDKEIAENPALTGQVIDDEE